jgi:hypothetical protein
VANIPLYKYGEIEFPLTPKSTLNFWAVQGFYHKKGPFSNAVTKIGGRWYIKTGPSDVTVGRIIDEIETLVRDY